jgi:protein arginine kinase activator
MNKVMCSVCNKKPATIHYTDVVNGVPQTRKFCTNCAKTIGLFDASAPFNEMMKSFDNVMKSFDEAFKGFDLNTPKEQDVTCSDCGMTLSKFRETGRFGCAKDYELFNVGPMLEKIHNASVHTGKAPKKSAEDKIKHLKRHMEDAVKAENYEKAAELRDEIKKLETAK